MASVKLNYGTASALTFASLASLGSGAYAVSSAVDNTANLYEDYLIEISLTPGTVTGNVQAVVFAVASIDGTDWEDAPADNSTTTTYDANMASLGTLQLTSSQACRSKAMSVAAAFGGVCPPKFKIVVKNDSGVAWSGGAGQYLPVNHTVA